jgi:4-hydroxybenzoate polyprenyltransferase
VLSAYLVRPWAWWFNKVPLSVTLLLLLLDSVFTIDAFLALSLVVLAVCAVGNYGYGLNDLYDVEEDRRAKRANTAVALGKRRIILSIVVSAFAAEMLAAGAAGVGGALLTFFELLLPLAYSVPPLRLKKRKWLGIAADAAAAHVYPAVLALAAVAHLGLRPISAVLVIFVLGWSGATGVRGILSHQLNTAERDRQSGLATVARDLGHSRLEHLIVRVLLPIEAAAFLGIVLACNGGPLLWVFIALYAACEAFRMADGRFTVTALRPQGQPYLALLEESFYKAWGPIVIAMDAARIDAAYLVLIPIYVLLFKLHIIGELHKLGRIGRALARPGPL